MFAKHKTEKSDYTWCVPLSLLSLQTHTHTFHLVSFERIRSVGYDGADAKWMRQHKSGLNRLHQMWYKIRCLWTMENLQMKPNVTIWNRDHAGRSCSLYFVLHQMVFLRDRIQLRLLPWLGRLYLRYTWQTHVVVHCLGCSRYSDMR